MEEVKVTPSDNLLVYKKHYSVLMHVRASNQYHLGAAEGFYLLML